MGVRKVGLLEAALAPELLNVSPFPRQRELLEAIADHQTTVACCGRRSGKTRTAAAVALHNLLLTPELDAMVAPGEKRYAISVANSQAQARIFVDHARALVKASPTLGELLVSETMDELVFEGDRVLRAFPCSARTGRGYAASFLLLDELAHYFSDDLEGPAVAQRVYAAMTPSLATFGEHGRLVVASTPLGDDGLFATLYKQVEDGELAGGVAFHGTTREMNPAVTEAYLASQEVALGADDFAREYEAVFARGGASYIDRDRLLEVVADRDELPVHAGHAWQAALDPSFSRDATALVVVGRDPFDRERLVLGYAGRWLPPKPKGRRRVLRSREEQAAIADEILDAVVAVLRRFELRTVMSDQHQPGVVTHELAKRGIHVNVRPWTASSRNEALQALRARIHSGRIELYDPRGVPLMAELLRLRTRTRAGSSSVEVPRVGDSHGDVALALAAAVFAHDRAGVAGADRVLPRSLEGGTVPKDAGTLAVLNGGADPTRRPKWYDRTRSIREMEF
jgi:phage terminase large subunit-like protein